MSKKSKSGVALDLASPYGVDASEVAKARLKHMTLVQDFLELQKEVDVIRSNLEAGKQRKMVLAAEVRFLRKRHEFFVKTKTLNSSHKEKLAQPSNLPKQTKHMTGFNKKAAGQHKLPPIPECKPKRKHYIGKESASPVRHQSLTPVADLDHKGRTFMKKKNVTQRNIIPLFDLNEKEITYANDVTLRNTAVTFDMNQDNNKNLHAGNEVFMHRRAPIFDLNEISTGDEDFQNSFEALKFEEVQNDLMLSVCRNDGEGPSRVGKRKISWQDPVALRVLKHTNFRNSIPISKLLVTARSPLDRLHNHPHQSAVTTHQVKSTDRYTGAHSLHSVQVLNRKNQTGKFNFTTQFPDYREIVYKPDFGGRQLGKNVVFDMDMSVGDF